MSGASLSGGSMSGPRRVMCRSSENLFKDGLKLLQEALIEPKESSAEGLRESLMEGKDFLFRRWQILGRYQSDFLNFLNLLKISNTTVADVTDEIKKVQGCCMTVASFFCCCSGFARAMEGVSAIQEALDRESVRTRQNDSIVAVFKLNQSEMIAMNTGAAKEEIDRRVAK